VSDLHARQRRRGEKETGGLLYRGERPVSIRAGKREGRKKWTRAALRFSRSEGIIPKKALTLYPRGHQRGREERKK